jgi:2-polyprenyl-3-methyl-5-hydroxy-6-metoxy-1,4-benzoquinol methylase
MSNHVQENIGKCPLCENIISIKSLFIIDGFNIVKCNYCDLCYVSPQPSKYFIEEYYKNSNSIWNFSENEKPNSKFLIDKIKIFKNEGSLLDIGSSNGHFLNEAKMNGFGVQGIDLNSAAIDYCQNIYKIKVFNTDFLDFNTEVKYDVVTMFRLFEHIKYPNEYLSKINKILVNDGLLAITVPNFYFGVIAKKISSILPIFKKLENEINVFRPPAHLFFYSPKTLIDMLIKHGYEPIKVINTFPTFKNKNTKMNFYKINNYFFSEVFRYISLNKIFLNHNFLVIAKKI